MKKNKVICDTNIWYDLDLGNETLKDGYQYIVSSANISDFLSSSKLDGSINQIEKLKGAVKTMNDLGSQIIYESPYFYAARDLFQGILRNENELHSNKDAAEALVSFATLNTPIPWGPFVDNIKERKRDFQIQTHSLINRLKSESLFQNSGEEFDHNFEYSISMWIFDLLKKWYCVKSEPWEVNNWRRLEVFVKTYKRFLVNIKEPPNMNSMIDLIQLLYIDCNNEYLFWTKEKKILKKISQEFDSKALKNILYQNAIQN